jgi:hypothetical protein
VFLNDPNPLIEEAAQAMFHQGAYTAARFMLLGSVKKVNS